MNEYAKVSYYCNGSLVSIKKKFTKQSKYYYISKEKIQAMDWKKLAYAVLKTAYHVALEPKQENKVIERLNADNFENRMDIFIDVSIDELLIVDDTVALRMELEETKRELERLKALMVD